MYVRPLRRLLSVARAAAPVLPRHLLATTRPVTDSFITGRLADVVRGKPRLVAENALLWQQLIVLRRSVTRLRCTRVDRTLLVLLASRLHS